MITYIFLHALFIILLKSILKNNLPIFSDALVVYSKNHVYATFICEIQVEWQETDGLIPCFKSLS